METKEILSLCSVDSNSRPIYCQFRMQLAGNSADATSSGKYWSWRARSTGSCQDWLTPSQNVCSEQSWLTGTFLTRRWLRLSGPTLLCAYCAKTNFRFSFRCCIVLQGQMPSKRENVEHITELYTLELLINTSLSLTYYTVNGILSSVKRDQYPP